MSEAYLDKRDENGRLYVSPATEFLSYAREYEYDSDSLYFSKLLHSRAYDTPLNVII